MSRHLSPRRKRHLARLLAAVMLATPAAVAAVPLIGSGSLFAQPDLPRPDQPVQPAQPVQPVPARARISGAEIVEAPGWGGRRVRIVQRSEGGPFIEVMKIDSGMLPLEGAALHADAATRTLRVDVTQVGRTGPVTSDARQHIQRVAIPLELEPGEWTLLIRERHHMADGPTRGTFTDFTAGKPGTIRLIAANRPVAPDVTVTGQIESVTFARRPATSVDIEPQQPADGRPAALRLSLQDAANQSFSASLQLDAAARKLQVQVTRVRQQHPSDDRKTHEQTLELPADLPAGTWVVTVGERVETHADGMVGVGPFRDGAAGGLEVRRSGGRGGEGGRPMRALSDLPAGWKLLTSTSPTEDGPKEYALQLMETTRPNQTLDLRADVDHSLRTIRVWLTVISDGENDWQVEEEKTGICQLGPRSGDNAIGNGRWTIEIHRRQRHPGPDGAPVDSPFSLVRTIDAIVFSPR